MFGLRRGVISPKKFATGEMALACDRFAMTSRKSLAGFKYPAKLAA